MERRIQVYATGLCGVALVLAIIATAIPYWTVYSETHYMGLWHVCYEKLNGTQICSDAGYTSYIRLVEAFIVVGDVALFITFIVGLVLVFFRDHKCLVYTCLITSAFALGGFGTGVIRYGLAADTKPLHAGFGLAVVSGIFSMIVFMIFYAFKND